MGQPLVSSIAECVRRSERERILKRLQEAERIDRRNGFTLPGDSALYVALWALGCEQGDEARSVTTAA